MAAQALSAATRRELRQVFDAVDKSRRGKISASELAFLIRAFDERKSDWEVQDLISEIDVGGHSGDGRVDFDEFVALMCRSFKADRDGAATGANARRRKRKDKSARAAAGTAAAAAGGTGAFGGASKRGADDIKALSFQLLGKAAGAAGSGGNASNAAATAAAAAAALSKAKGMDDEQLHRFELRQAFAYLDWDGDGTISADDLRQSFASIGDSYTALEIDEMIREVSTAAAVAVHPHMTGVVEGAAAAAALLATAGGAAAAAGVAGGAAGATTLLSTRSKAGAAGGDGGFEIGPVAGSETPDTITLSEFMTALSP